MAALRFLLGGISTSITQVAAFTSRMQRNLCAVDTANALVHLDNGNSGTLSISYGTRLTYAFEIEIITDQGAVLLTPTSVETTRHTAKNNTKKGFVPDNGVHREVAVFAKGIENGKIDPRGTPEEALADLKVVQAVLESGRDGGTVKGVK